MDVDTKITRKKKHKSGHESNVGNKRMINFFLSRMCALKQMQPYAYAQVELNYTTAVPFAQNVAS